MVTVKTVLSLSAAKKWHLHQIDVYSVFLQDDLNDEIYLQLPQGFNSQGENMVGRLMKSLYGLKQAPRKWNAKLTEAFSIFEFVQSRYDHSLFVKKSD